MERIQIVENLGKEEIQQRPQLAEVVLQRSSGQQEAVRGVEQLELLDQAGKIKGLRQNYEQNFERGDKRQSCRCEEHAKYIIQR